MSGRERGPGGMATWVRAAVTVAALAAAYPALAGLTLSTSFELGNEPPPPEGVKVPEPAIPSFWVGHALSRSADGSVGWEKAVGRKGARCLSVSSAGGNFGAVGPRIPTTEGAWVEVRAWIRTFQATGGAGVWILWLDAEGKLLGASRSQAIWNELPPPDDLGPGEGLAAPKRDAPWRLCAVEGQAPGGTAACQPALVTLAAGMAWFDDVQVREEQTAALTLREVQLGPIRPGEPCSVRFALAAADRFPIVSSVELSLVGRTSLRLIAHGQFPLETPRGVAAGEPVRFGPFLLDVDRYAPPGEYALSVRCGVAVLEAQTLPGGSGRLLPPSGAVEGGPIPSLAMDVPGAARAGDPLRVSLSLRLDPPETAPRLAAVRLSRGGAVYAACEALLSDDGAGWLVADATLRPPAACESGEYLLEAFPLGPLGSPGLVSRPLVLSGEGEGTRPLSFGRYRSRAGSAHGWRTTESGSLVWDGLAWTPAGVALLPTVIARYSAEDPVGNEERWSAFEDVTRRLAERGISDVYLRTGVRGICDTPLDLLQRTVDRLEELGFSYGLEIGGGQPRSYSGHRLGGSWTLDGAEAGTDNAVEIFDPLVTGASSALVALFGAGDSRLPLQLMRVPLDGPPGQPDAPILRQVGLRIPAETAGGPFHARVTPEAMVPPFSGPGDLGDEAEYRSRKSTVCRRLEELRFGEGLRFLTNPLATEVGPPLAEVLPGFPGGFPEAYAAWLRDRFGEVEALRQAWAFAEQPEPPTTFASAARLVPLESPDGSWLMADPQGERYHVIAPARSSWLADLEAFRQESQASCLQDIAAAVKTLIDVPVLLAPDVTVGTERRGLGASMLGTGLHMVGSGDSDGIDGVLLADPGGVDELAEPLLATRLEENRLASRAPWLLASCPVGDPDARARLATWGARGGWLDLGECGAGAAVEALLPASWQGRGLETVRERWLDSTAPILIGAFPQRLRTPIGVPDERPLALSGGFGPDAAIRLAEGVWLVPAARLSPLGSQITVVSLPNASRLGTAAAQLERYLAGSPGGVVVVGSREDLGAVPTLDSLLTASFAPCPYGSGEAQVPSSSWTPDPAPSGQPGAPTLCRRGGLWLFPVRGLTRDDARWLLGGFFGDTADGGGPRGR